MFFSLITDFVSNLSQYVLGPALALSIVIFVHEYGHYMVARLFRIPVQVFSIGFGPELWGWFSRQGVRWRISAIPLGGYVQFVEKGNGNAEDVPTASSTSNATNGGAYRFFSDYPIFNRMAVILAGPVANFLFSIFLFAGLAWFAGQTIVQPVVGKVKPGSAAEVAGILPGDRIVAVDEVPVKDFYALAEAIRESGGKSITLSVKRNGGERKTIVAVPEIVEERTKFGMLRHPVLGIVSGGKDFMKRVKLSPVEAAVVGVTRWASVIMRSVDVLAELVMGKTKVSQLNGVVGIAVVVGSALETGIFNYIFWLAVISTSIGFINLLPIPILDGGYLAFGVVEILRGGRPVPESVQRVGFTLGFILLILITVFANYNDIRNLILYSYS